MAHLITLPVHAPPDTVNILADFYDADERNALLASPIGSLLSKLPTTLAVPTPDLCSYYLYYKRRPGVPGHSQHDDIARQWPRALVEFDGQIDFANSSLRLIQAAGLDTGTIERFGEALGLSVASSIHGLHQADWSRVAETTGRRTLDFWRPWTASDGRQFIQVEAKGSAIANNDRKASTISNHKASIKAKKTQATREERKSSVLYGTIGVLDERPDSIARCWLVDPPADVPDDPERFKILTRLTYIAELISFLGPRSALAASLRTRIAAMNAITDIASLDGIPLLRGDGEPYSAETYDLAGQHNSWFSSKSVVTDGPAAGQVFVIDRDRLLFVAIREQLIVYAAEQDFAVIQEYTFPSGTLQKDVACVVSRGRFDREFAPVIALRKAKRSAGGGYVRFTLPGQLYYCQSGLVFGVLMIS